MTDRDVAIIGMECRVPGASGLEQFWAALTSGRECIRAWTREELIANGCSDEAIDAPNFVGATADIDDCDMFDNHFFGMSPAEASLLDPQQRTFIECAWQALERAGYEVARTRERIGVYAGQALSGYLVETLGRVPEVIESFRHFPQGLYTEKDYVAARAAFHLGLRGPAISIQTACSTGLVAVHTACSALRAGDCDVALAGACAIHIPMRAGYTYEAGSIASPDGHCRPFDRAASGTVLGGGVGVVVLKPLRTAVRDGDWIHAVIRGSAVNNDGVTKTTFTSPSVAGQADVIGRALASAGVRPSQIGYVETHGTATELGDPVEVAALREVWQSDPGSSRCCLGAVKANIGHPDAASGIIGLIKAALVVERGTLPPQINFEHPNPKLELDSSPFFVSTELTSWRPKGRRRAGVSSFGIGGTNAHVVIEQGPPRATRPLESPEPALILVSGRDVEALEASAKAVADHILVDSSQSLQDVAYSLQVGRTAWPHRACAVVDDRTQLGRLATGEFRRAKPETEPRVVFMFPGQGSQYPNMARQLTTTSPVFAFEVARCLRILRGIGLDLEPILFGDATTDAALTVIDETEWAQPALFVIEYSLAMALMSWGIRPTAMIGHSIGEYVAATLSGVFTLEDALGIVAKRGVLMQRTQPGAMLAVALPEEEVGRLLFDGLDLAVVNGPRSCVVAGSIEAVDRLTRTLSPEIRHTRLRTRRAFHSALMEPILSEFEAFVTASRMRTPQTPYTSNLDGGWATDSRVLDPGYWSAHLRQTVRFAENLRIVCSDPATILLEVGPGHSLSAISASTGHPQATISTVPQREEEGRSHRVLLEALGELWSAGVVVDWIAFHRGKKRHRVPLPTYPFKRHRLWLAGTVRGPLPTPDLPVPADTPVAAKRVPPEQRPLDPDAMSRIWADTLGVESLDPDANFFEAGGHSLVAIQLVTRIERAWPTCRVTPRQILANPTPRALCAALAETDADFQGAGSRTVLEGATSVVDDVSARYRPFPLTPLQQAYWVGRDPAFELGSRGTNAYTELDFRELDLGRCNAVLNHLVARHEMLRAITTTDGKQQILRSTESLSIELEDLTGVAAERAEARVAQKRNEMSTQTFDTTRWPLFDVRLTHLPSGSWRLHLSVDYMMFDARSFQILSRESVLLYDQPSRELPPIGLSFRDYVLSIPSAPDEEEVVRAREYWWQRLDTLPGPPQLPMARSPRDVTGVPLTRRAGGLEAGLWTKLKAAAASRDLTPSGLMAAIFAQTLAAWSESARFAVNVTLFNRRPVHPDIDAVVGDFTSNLILECDSEAPDFEAFSTRLQDRLWSDLDHRAVGGVELMREMTRRSGSAVAPAMPVVFTSLLNHGQLDRGVPSIPWLGRAAYSSSQAPQVLIDQAVGENEDGSLYYSWDVLEEAFSPGLMADIVGAYSHLLRQLAESESWTIRPDLRPLHQRTSQERFNSTPAITASATLHGPFLDRCEDDPNRLAVLAPGMSLTYGHLYRLAATAARRLQEAGLHPGECVGIVMDKGWEQVVAAVAVLAAGGAYVPIDPALPRARILHLIERTGIRLSLTQDWVRSALEWPAAHIPVVVTEVPETTAASLPMATSPSDLAYIIFTSGSTGQPKGVAIEHRGAANTILDINQRFAVGPEDRILALSSLSFDLSVYDIFGALAAGAAVVIPPKRPTDDLDTLWQWSMDSGVTVWNSVPSLLQMMVDHLSARSKPGSQSIRLALLSGDWIPVTLPDKARELLEGLTLVSLGGATEASIWSIAYPIDVVDSSWKSIPYGWPLAGQSVRVLDVNGLERPVWVSGELSLGGIGVARGYFGDPDRTAERFSTDEQSGERRYKTGDRGRYLPDGSIEFMGRLDHQLKVRGFRIEPGEIEAALRTHPNVADAIVVAVGEDNRDRSLVAYIQPSSETEEAPRADRNFDAGLDRWRRVFDAVYADELRGRGRIAAGWRSTFTGQPFSDAEMDDWIQGTVGRVVELQPASILEIGSGSGMMLEQLAPKTHRYRAIDLSSEAVEAVRSRLVMPPFKNLDVAVAKGAAHHASALWPEKFGLILMNSVVQYFPSGMYLEQVLESAIDACEDRGRIFIGDVRDLSLLKAFATAVELARADASTTVAALRTSVAERIAREAELLVSPAYFLGLQDTVPRVRRVSISPRLSRLSNEMTNYRYDVLIELDSVADDVLDLEPVDWRDGVFDRANLGAMLARRPMAPVAVTGIPNPRLQQHMKMLQSLEHADAEATVRSVRGMTTPDQSIDPMDLVDMAREYGYRVDLDWSGHSDEGNYTAMFTPQPDRRRLRQPERHDVGDPMFNTPAYEGSDEHQSDLASYLRERLPNYMVPSRFITVGAFPLTVNGKVDRARLPAVDLFVQGPGRPDGELTTLQRTVLAVWEEVLGRESLDVDADFFSLDGNSLRAVQIMSRLEESLGRRLPLRVLFDNATVRRLSQAIEAMAEVTAAPRQSQRTEELVDLVRRMSADELQQALNILTGAASGADV